MKFTMNRNHVVASTSGHVLKFTKGEPMEVPPEAVREVMAVGGLPEDEDFDPSPPKKDGPQEPSDPIERQIKLFDAFAAIVERGRREDFTAGGTPHQKALATELGWPVPAKERDAAWVEFNAGKSK